MDTIERKDLVLLREVRDDIRAIREDLDKIAEAVKTVLPMVGGMFGGGGLPFFDGAPRDG